MISFTTTMSSIDEQWAVHVSVRSQNYVYARMWWPLPEVAVLLCLRQEAKHRVQRNASVPKPGRKHRNTRWRKTEQQNVCEALRYVTEHGGRKWKESENCNWMGSNQANQQPNKQPVKCFIQCDLHVRKSQELRWRKRRIVVAVAVLRNVRGHFVKLHEGKRMSIFRSFLPRKVKCSNEYPTENWSSREVVSRGFWNGKHVESKHVCYLSERIHRSCCVLRGFCSVRCKEEM